MVGAGQTVRQRYFAHKAELGVRSDGVQVCVSVIATGTIGGVITSGAITNHIRT